MSLQAVGMRISHLRIAKGLEQSEFATVLGVGGQSTVAMWETGKRMIRPAEAGRLAAFAGVSLDYIYLGKENAKRMPRFLRMRIKELEELGEASEPKKKTN